MQGDLALIFVITFRFLAPFTILRWPLFGGILSIVADATDVMIFDKFGKGPLTDHFYHNFDKFFDIYYLGFEAYVATRWKDTLARKTAQILFTWRLLGVITFELLAAFSITFRPVFLLAPNIFENFFLFMIVAWKVNPKLKLNSKSLTIILLIVGIPKLIQEYVMHFKYPDQTWHFLKNNLFFFLYR